VIASAISSRGVGERDMIQSRFGGAPPRECS
jgi:hypothetical protein